MPICFCFFIFLSHCERSFKIVGNEFQLDGKPFQYLSGSFHYFRQNPKYWEEIMMKMRNGGCNTLHTFIPWNLHEPKKGNYNFDGIADLNKFLLYAKELELYVILQPGPYICADLDLGGFPYWLLKEENITVRSSDPLYMKHVTDWFTQLFKILKPHMYHNGGNVIMMQIEHEFGTYAPQSGDEKYLEQLCNLVHEMLGEETVLYTTDGPSLYYLQRGSIKSLAYATVDFGTGDPTMNFELERSWNNGTGPYVNSEFYTGWVDHWKDEHHKVSTDSVCSSLDKMLSMGASVNMYMYVGGTNFGYISGASGGSSSTPYLPYITSYDYDAPISESGDLTWKYQKIREVAKKYFEVPDYNVTNTTKKAYGSIYQNLALTIYDALDIIGNVKKEAEQPMAMEDLDVDYGFVLYQKNITDGESLEIPKCRDMCYVYLNRILNCVIYNGEEKKCQLLNKTGQLDILVENMGRASYGKNFFQKKGIIGNVLLNGDELKGWKMTGFNMSNIKQLPFEPDHEFHVPKFTYYDFFIDYHKNDLHDTFLNIKGWKRGVVFVNYVNIGRYWDVGPQLTLYIPKHLLRTGENLIYVFDCEDSQTYVPISLDDKPQIDIN